jgi:thiamine transporter
MLVTGALCVALSFVLSCIALYRLPQGGTITAASMLPIMLFSWMYGPIAGVCAGLVHGILQLVQGVYVIHPIQLLVDYPMAYAAVVLACVANVLPVKKVFKLPIAVILGYLGRYLMAVLSGCVFFAEYAGEQNALIYSLIYNISYIGPEMLACAALMFLPSVHRLPEIIRGNRR